jgi:hypothetical protein
METFAAIRRGPPRRALACAALFSLLIASGCASIDIAPIERLDERSGDTLIIVRQPLNFVRIRPDILGMRDYVTLVAVEEDHVGQYNSYVLAYRWSTIEKSLPPPPENQVGPLQIDGDAQWSLTPLAEVPASLQSRRDLYAPYPLIYGISAYRIGLAELRAIATSSTLTLRPAHDDLPQPLQLLDDGRPALREFAQREGGK